MSQPDAIEALTVAIRSDLDAVHAQIVAEIAAAATVLYTQPVAARVARLRALERTLVALADQADAIAARHVVAAVQGAYEIGAWTTAVTTGTSATFAAVDVDAVTHIATDTMDSLLHATKGVREDVKVMIREVVRDKVRAKVIVGQTAIDAGRDLAAELAERGVTAVTYSDGRRVTLPTYAEMVVRTKTAEAYQEGGFNQGERLGIEWWEVMDGPGCGWSSHDDPQTADGMIVTLEIARQHPTSHPNCVMPETVSGFYGGVDQLVRARYDGPAYTLTWSTPAGLHAATVGPNHPVLTAAGWKAAHLVDEGDQLIHDTHAPLPASVLAATETDLEQAPPTIAEQFEALRALGRYSRVAATRHDLHGDAVFSDGEVDVVDVDRVLLGEAHSSFLKHPFERQLMWTDVVPVDEVRGGPQQQLVTGAALPSDGVVRGGGAAAALLRRGALGCESVSLGDAAAVAVAPESGADRRGGHPGAGGDLGRGQVLCDVQVDEGLDRHSGSGHRFVLAQVVSVKVERFCGWVYDSSTAGGAFTANGLVVRNCRRATSPRPDIASAREARDASPTPSGDAARDQEVAVALQARAQRLVAVSAGAGARTSAALDLQAGTVPPVAAAQRHAALVRRRA